MRVVLVAVGSGVLFFLSQGVADVWALGWVAPVPLLWFAYGPAPRWQVCLASLAGFAFGQLYLAQIYWGQLPAAVIVPLVTTLCVAFAVAVLFSAEALRRGSIWGALLAFPALWTALEYTIGLVSPHGSFGALGYAQVSFPAGIQIAALFGVHAVTFLLGLCANAMALLLRRRWTAGGVGAAVCALVIVFGFCRLAEVQGPRIRVVALADAGLRNAQHREHTRAAEEAATQSYAAYIRQLQDVRVVAIPEGAVQFQADDQRVVLAPLAAAAATSGAMVVVGTFTPEPERNRAFALLPDGTIESYEKRHLLAPFETAVPGRTAGLLGAGYATQICKDMDFAGTVRATAEQGVRLMIVPADDFGRDQWIHARIAIMRGVENGFAVLRAAFDGLETISDAQGRVLVRATTTPAGMIAAQAEVPLGSGPTLYTRIGDTFAWACALLCLILAVRMYFRTHDRSTTAPPDVASPTDDRA
jgi:apolipoprotein N-acyltransferase